MNIYVKLPNLVNQTLEFDIIETHMSKGDTYFMFNKLELKLKCD